MLSLAKAHKDYYLQKVGEITPREDYYLRGGTATGRWHGNGAAELGTHLCRALLDFLPLLGREVPGKELLAIVLPPTPRLRWPEPAHQPAQTEVRSSGRPELPFRPHGDPGR